MNVAFSTSSAPYEKSKSLGSGGSMVARLKLKGIDGRAPPGVNKKDFFVSRGIDTAEKVKKSLCSGKQPERVRWVCETLLKQ